MMKKTTGILLLLVASIAFSDDSLDGAYERVRLGREGLDRGQGARRGEGELQRSQAARQGAAAGACEGLFLGEAHAEHDTLAQDRVAGAVDCVGRRHGSP